MKFKTSILGTLFECVKVLDSSRGFQLSEKFGFLFLWGLSFLVVYLWYALIVNPNLLYKITLPIKKQKSL